MTIAVMGGTGSVGSAALRALQASGADHWAIVRTADKISRLTRPPRYVLADLDAPDSLAPAMEGAQTLLLISPMHPDEADSGLAAVAAARQAGVRRIVYQSVLRRPGMDHILHYRSKLPVEAAILEGGFDSVIYRPNSFHQNDNFLRAAILSGVYPQPVGSIGVSRLDVRDIGAAAAKAVLEPAAGHLDYELHGPEAITGARTAEIFAAALGRDVRYGGDDVDRWAASAEGVMAGWMIEALAQMYRHFQAHGMQPAAGLDPVPILPETLISTADYALEKAKEWATAA